MAAGTFLFVGSGFGSAAIEVTAPLARFTIAIEQLLHVPGVVPLLVTKAKFRRLSTATPVGAVPTGIDAKTVAPVATSMTLMSFEPRFTTTAWPVAVLTATPEGCVPTVGVLTTIGPELA